MKKQILVHRIYLKESKAILRLHRDPAEVAAHLKSAGIQSPAISPEGDVVVSDVPVDTILTALGFDGDGFMVSRQDGCVTIQEVLDA